MQEVILFYKNVPTRQILDSSGAVPTKTVADAKKDIQEMAEYSQKWHNGTSRGRSTETSDGLAAIQAQLNNLGREIKKVNEKVYAAQVGCEQCKGPHYTKDCPLKEEGKTLEEAYYTQFGGPFQGGGYRATTLGFYQRNNTNPSYQERRQSMEDTLSKFMGESAKRHEENSNLIKEIRASTDAAIRNQGASIKTLEIQIGQMSKVLHERGFGSLPSSTETNQTDQVKSISTTIEADSHLIGRIGSSQYAVSTGQNNTLLYKSRQTTVPFPSRLDNYYYEKEEGNYGPKLVEAYGASYIKESIPQKEKDLGSFTLPCFINNVCFDNALVDLGASVSVMHLLTYLNLGLGELAHTKLTVELADKIVKYPKGIAENVLVRINKFTFPVDFMILDMPEDVKVPLILGRPFLFTAHAKIDVYKRKITLRVGEEKIIFKSVKPDSSLIKRVYMLSLRERMELDLEARLMGETLVIDRSLDPLNGDYIELNDLNEPFELRRDQGDDLMPTIEEGKVIKEFRTRDENLDTGIDDYPSYYNNDKKIHIDCAHSLKFSCMIGFEFTHVNFFPLLYVNVMSKKFHNSIMKDKMVYKGDNVVGALMNVPIFVGTFFVVTAFAVLEDMDDYHDEGMGDVIVGEPFLSEVGIKARRFDGMITIYNGDDEVNVVKLNGKSIWEIEIEENDSRTWKAILSLRSKPRDSVWKKLGDGKSTNIWFDKWCEEDNKGTFGKFSIRKVWEIFKEVKDDVKWYKVVWFSQCNPRYAFILWLALQKRSATQDRLMAWNKNVQMPCPLCKSENDSHDHLFFKCPFSKDVWSKIKGKLNESKWDSSCENVIDVIANEGCRNSIRSVIQRITIATSVYYIWNKKNKRIFTQEQRSCQCLFNGIEESIKLQHLSLKVKRSIAVMKLHQMALGGSDCLSGSFGVLHRLIYHKVGVQPCGDEWLGDACYAGNVAKLEEPFMNYEWGYNLYNNALPCPAYTIVDAGEQRDSYSGLFLLCCCMGSSRVDSSSIQGMKVLMLDM
ncbi:mitochondrial proton/calcium exchanger protein-like protein isoform X1 [Tanacetum coccineum]|uniref:Mitochondrial proton/calcium exchanger protein-like protein isoform X1 n=1 Tax=Tanacetum coccineum TaxID=301880 RepID=A0ABQ5AR70_9ASTR